MENIIRQVMLNHLIYNPNRDPEVYRRPPGKPFHIQALLAGRGKARVTLEVEGSILCEEEIELPGTFDCTVTLDAPGLHPAFLTAAADGHLERRYLPLDVEASAWAH
ncbi:MAG: hypothetical protein D6819_05220 [Gammaproteobacteria bacterium]|nr:MAG: hypothetical protein D6819_05220 [Gammaproteobacteria bacterium]